MTSDSSPPTPILSPENGSGRIPDVIPCVERVTATYWREWYYADDGYPLHRMIRRPMDQALEALRDAVAVLTEERDDAVKAANAMSADVTHFGERVAVLTEERDAAEARVAEMVTRWKATAEESEARVAVLEAGLQRYGEHEAGCVMGDACNCGLRALLGGTGSAAARRAWEWGRDEEGHQVTVADIAAQLHGRYTIGDAAADDWWERVVADVVACLGVPAAAPPEDFTCPPIFRLDEPAAAPEQSVQQIRDEMHGFLDAPYQPERCRECGGVVDSPGTVRYARCTNEFHERCPTCGSTDRDAFGMRRFGADRHVACRDAWHDGETP